MHRDFTFNKYYKKYMYHYLTNPAITFSKIMIVNLSVVEYIRPDGNLKYQFSNVLQYLILCIKVKILGFIKLQFTKCVEASGQLKMYIQCLFISKF